MKRTLPITLSVILLILMASCTGAGTPTPEPQSAAPNTQETPIPARPTIRLSIAGETYDGLPGASCWLQAENDIRCEPEPLDMQPADPITIEQGEAVTILVESELGSPAALHGTLLDDLDTDNAPVMLSFEPSNSVEYVVDLDPGQHRLSVVAEYPTLESDTSFVTVVFALEIPEAVVVVIEPTEVPPTEEPTAAPTDEAPAEPTGEPTAEPTAEPTKVEPTEVPPTPAPPTATPRPTAVPIEGPIPPAIVVVNGASQFMPSGTEYCVEQGGTEVCSEIPGSARSMRIQVKDGDTVRIDAIEGVPTSLRFALKSNDLSQEFDSAEIPGNTLSLYAVEGETGSYVLAISAEWPDGTATYYFRVQISE